jgi:predicted TIM-barrel fold metal-dependent hydrolase
VVDDRSDNRVLEMDAEGSDVHFLVPSVWTSVVGLPDVSLEIGLIRAYHRFMHEFCGRSPTDSRARSSPRRATSARRCAKCANGAIQNGRSRCNPLLDNDRPVDHPDLEPIWRAAEEHDLAIVHHSFTWSPPYFPGYEDMWDNVYLARLCSHPWGAMRFMAGFLAGGILDRYPGLRLCVLECGFG